MPEHKGGSTEDRQVLEPARAALPGCFDKLGTDRAA